MKIITKEGKLKVENFRCVVCGTEWSDDKSKYTVTPYTKIAHSGCPMCHNMTTNTQGYIGED